jgi:hypothetical protein
LPANAGAICDCFLPQRLIGHHIDQISPFDNTSACNHVSTGPHFKETKGKTLKKRSHIACVSPKPPLQDRPFPIHADLQFVADGVFYAELNEFFTRELAEQGYSGCEVRVTPARTEIILRATHTQEVLGDKGRRIRELTALVQKRFKFRDGTVELYAEKVQQRGLSAVAQCESLRYKLLSGLAVRR